MTGLRTVIASLRDGLVRRDFKGRRPARWAISPPHESIIKNTDEKADDLDHEHGFQILMMLRKSGSSPSKDKNNLEWDYSVMKQQLKMMNMKFGEVMNEMGRLRIEVASLQHGLVCEGPKGGRPAKRATSPSDKSITKVIDGKADDFNREHDVRFQQHKTCRHGGLLPHDYFIHIRAYNSFRDDLDRNL